MKTKFIKNVMLFLFPIFVLGGVTEFYLRQIPNNYSYKKEYLDTNAATLEVIYLGNSHVYYGVNPEYSSFKSFNASNISQSIDIDYMLLKKYGNSFRNLKYIVIPIDYFTLYNRMESGIEAWRLKNYTIYMDLFMTTKLVDHFEILNGNLLDQIKRINRFGADGKNDIKCNPLGFGLDYSSKFRNDLIETGKTAAKRHTVNDDGYLNSNVQILDSIIDFSTKRKLQVILLSTPVYMSYFRNLDAKQLNKSKAICRQFVVTHSNVHYLDLMNNGAFYSIDFYDADHLNEVGARKLTLMVDNIIRTKR